MRLIILSLLIPLIINGQTPKNANYWFFGNGIGLNFNNKPPSLIGTNNTSHKESNSSYSDNNGVLVLYYYDDSIFDNSHNMITNGYGIKGFSSSSQASLILKHNQNDSIYFLFTNVPCSSSLEEGIYLTKIIVKNGIFYVKGKNIKLSSSATEKLNAVYHQNGNDIWIVSHRCNSSVFELFLLTKSDVDKCSVEQEIGANLSGNAVRGGYLKFSPSGKYMANCTSVDSKLEIFNFNTLTGQLSNKISINESFCLGLEFSNDENYLYMFQVHNKYISQFSLKKYSTNDIKNSKVIIHSNSNNFFRGHCLQLAPDRKIYFGVADSNFLSCINFPDSQGLSCKFVRRQIELGSKKNDIGLANFNQSYFYTPAINYSYEMNCTKNSIQFWGKDTFGANSHNWQIRKLAVGNWQLAGSAKDINYSFADTGTYEVRYIAANGNKADTVTKSITIYDKIKKDFLGKDTVFAEGALFNKTLFAPVPNHCVRWQDSSSLNTFTATKKGTYICKVSNAAFCEVWDTIVISTCINNLNQPSLFRSRDTLKTWHLNADSFVWFRNNQLYKITKQPFLKLTDTGTYRVEAAKKGHCNSGSIGTNHVRKLSVNGVTISDLGIRVFPNPSSGAVRIESSDDFKLEVRDLLGRVFNPDVILKNFVPEIYSESIQLPKGIYFFVFDVEGYRVAEKVVVW